MAVLDKNRTAMVRKLDELISRLRSLFMTTYADALSMLRNEIENGADFSWKDNPMAEKKIDKLVDLLANKSNVIVSNGVTHYQQYGTQSALDAMRERARQIAAKYGNQKFINRGATDEIKALDKEATNQRRMDAVGGHSETVANRGGAMNNLSNRVWNLNDQVKKEIEIIVQDSIKKGYSTEYAIKLAKEYLNNPKEIDAWKQDKNGEWYQTPAAKDYHPGRGVYKSAIKNVERMIRTETMAAYRTAEIEQYQKNAMVKGYRIQLSSNHTTTHGHHGVKKISDICDRLQGDYPKTFVWTGWHPNCRCVLIPIMLTDEEFAEYLKAKREGKLNEFSQKTNIQDMPEQMDGWMDENEKRIRETIDSPKKELPPWVESAQKELAKEPEPRKEPEPKKEPELSPREKTIAAARERQKKRTKKEIADILARWKEHENNLHKKVELTAKKPKVQTEFNKIKDDDEKLKWAKEFFSEYYDRNIDFYKKQNLSKEYTVNKLMGGGLKSIIERLKKIWKKNPASMAKAKLWDKLDVIKEIDINKIRKEWRNEFNKVITRINDAKTDDEKFRMVAYANNIIEWSKIKGINADEVCLKFPVSLYTKFQNKFHIERLTEFFRKQKDYIPHLDFKDGDKTAFFHNADERFVSIYLQESRYSYEDGLANVIYHEYGHADDWLRGLRQNKDVIDTFDKLTKRFEKIELDDLKKWFEDYQAENKIKVETIESENCASLSDMIQALQGADQNACGGHKAGYFSDKSKRLGEFIAHLSELKYQGNSVIYQYDEDLYDELKELCKKIYPDE